MNEIFARRSIRKFLPTMVEDEKIEQLLRAAMAAPSAGNQQPWEFYVVRDKRVIQDLSHCSPYAGCAAGASLAIVVCSRDETCVFRLSSTSTSAQLSKTSCSKQYTSTSVPYARRRPV